MGPFSLATLTVQVFALRGPKLPRPHWTAFFPVPPGNEAVG